MSNNLTISGWLQKYDSINHLIDNSYAVTYSDLNNLYSIYERINQHLNSQEINIAIGWSLGGQILARLIADKLISVKKLILLAPAYQYVSDENIKCGYNKTAFNIFRTGFNNFPQQTISSFRALMKLHDSCSNKINDTIDSNPNNYQDWLRWLGELGQFSCGDLNFDNFPSTKIIHGKNDMVTSYQQAELFYQKIPRATLYLIENCGHMPHIHDINSIKQIIYEE